MNGADEEQRERRILEAEENVRSRRDEDGTLWRKVYFGGGEHLRNWLAQCRELAGEENVKLEQVEAKGLTCFEQGGEGLFRIWVRANDDRDLDSSR